MKRKSCYCDEMIERLATMYSGEFVCPKHGTVVFCRPLQATSWPQVVHTNSRQPDFVAGGPTTTISQ